MDLVSPFHILYEIIVLINSINQTYIRHKISMFTQKSIDLDSFEQRQSIYVFVFQSSA